MSTRIPVRITLKDFTAAATEFITVIETGGIALPDGFAIELMRNDVGSLSLLDSKSTKPQQRVDYAGQEFVPPDLTPSVSEALTLPRRRTDYGSTVDLFSHIVNLFISYSFSQEAAQMSTYFVFASWFPEALPVAPCLILAGAETESRLLLDLLSCLVRHAVTLVEINEKVFDCLPMHTQLTLLIRRVPPPMWGLLSASNHPHSFLPNKKGLSDLYSVKAAYAGSTLGEVGDDATLIIECTPSGGRLPVTNTVTLENIAADFQPKLLDYRFRNVARVREAEFDAPTLPAPLGLIAQALGICIVDAPHLQADVIRLLESQQAVLLASRLLNLNFIAIEALLAYCHNQNGPVRVGVSELAFAVTTILTDRSETAVFESKRMGSYLRQNGFCPKRDSQGYAIHLTADVRRLVHRLASDHQVGDSEQTLPGCPDCNEK